MTYIFGNLRTGLILDEIPLTGVSMTHQLNASGTLRGSFSLDMTGKSNADMVDATTPGRCFVCAERNGWPIWYGIVWSRVYQSQAKNVQFTASTLERYPERRFITTDQTFTDVEQMNIFRSLWNTLQFTADGNLGVIVPGAFPTIVPKNLTILASDWKTYDQAISAIADGDNGFDWTIDIGRSASGSYSKTLRVGYPTLGLSDGVPWQFEYPGSILNYYSTDGMSSAGTHVTVFGMDSPDAPMLTSTYVHSDLVGGASWLRFDVSVPKKWLNTQALVDTHAGIEGPKFRPPLTVIKVFLKGELAPEFGTYNLGDAATLIIKDPMYPNVLQRDTRLVGWNYVPPQGGATEEAELIFAGDELNSG